MSNLPERKRQIEANLKRIHEDPTFCHCAEAYGHFETELAEVNAALAARKFKPGDRVRYLNDEDVERFGFVQRYASEDPRDQLYAREGWNVLITPTDTFIPDCQYGFWKAEADLVKVLDEEHQRLVDFVGQVQTLLDLKGRPGYTPEDLCEVIERLLRAVLK